MNIRLGVKNTQLQKEKLGLIELAPNRVRKTSVNSPTDSGRTQKPHRRVRSASTKLQLKL
jgi:hypothetical protein